MNNTANKTLTNDEYRAECQSEEDIHKAVIEWADRQAATEPALELLFHPANGGKMPKGAAGKMVGFGLRQGVPDLLLPVRRQGAGGALAKEPEGYVQYSGLALELKSPSGRLRPSQEWWLARLREQGWAVAVAWSLDRAIHVIQRYLSGEHVPGGLDLSGDEPPRHVTD